MKVNANLFPMKAHYFLLFAATAPMLPFLPLFGRQLGLQSGITLIYSLLPFTGVLFKIFAGGLADSRNNHKTVLLVSMFVTTIGFFSIYFTPSIQETAVTSQHTNVSLDCSSVESLLRHEHKQEPCGRKAYLAQFTHQVNSTCSVQCTSSDSSLSELCTHWGLSDCSNSLSLSVIIDLYAAEKIANDSYLPILLASRNNASVAHPSCNTTTRVHHCKALCDNSDLMKYLDAPQVMPSLSQVMSYFSFWMFLCLMLVSWAFFASTVTLSDTVCFMLLGRYGGEYGTQRVWGAIGWGSAGMLAGLLIDVASGGETIKDYTPAFVLCLAFLVLDLLTVSRIKLNEDSRAQSPPSHRRKWCLSCDMTAISLLAQPRVLLFVVSCVVVGISTGALWTYQLMLVEEVVIAWQCDFQWIKLLDGLMLGIQCFVGELPFFLLAGKLLQKLGHEVCMSIVVVTFGFRFILYSLVVNPWYFLPIEVTQGLTFGLFYATMATYASKVALPGTEASMQAVVGAAFEGIGVALGNAVGGYIFFKWGGKQLFLSFGIFNVLFGLLFGLLNWLMNKFLPAPIYMQAPLRKCKTGRFAASYQEGKIVADLAEGSSLLDLATELARDERTLVSFVESPNTKLRGDEESPEASVEPISEFVATSLDGRRGRDVNESINHLVGSETA